MAKIKIDASKVLGIGATILAAAATLVSGIMEQKRTDAKIAEKVNETIKQLTEGKE